MIFHENRLLADDSHKISYLIFDPNYGKMSQNLSAAVVIGPSRVKCLGQGHNTVLLVRLKPAISLAQVKHITTVLLCLE